MPDGDREPSPATWGWPQTLILVLSIGGCVALLFGSLVGAGLIGGAIYGVHRVGALRAARPGGISAFEGVVSAIVLMVLGAGTIGGYVGLHAWRPSKFGGSSDIGGGFLVLVGIALFAVGIARLARARPRG